MQRQMKKFKDKEDFIENVRLNKFFKKIPALKILTFLSHYFKNNFKLIKTVFKGNAELFS